MMDFSEGNVSVAWSIVIWLHVANQTVANTIDAHKHSLLKLTRTNVDRPITMRFASVTWYKYSGGTKLII